MLRKIHQPQLLRFTKSTVVTVQSMHFSSNKPNDDNNKDKYLNKYKWISKTYRPYNYEVNYREVD